MKIAFDQYNKAFENRLRLQIMSVLVANPHYDFNALKELLNVSDGNLAAHIKALEKEDYLIINKTFVVKKPNTQYFASEKGREAFKKHLQMLENLILQQKQ